MTITWETNVTEVVWESQTAPGITWTTVVGGTSSGGGVTVHNDLSGRSAADAHPMSAITDLEPALTDIATAVQAQQGDIGTLQTAVAGKQAADADLTAIAALAPADDALIQRKAGAWTSRTPAQVKADMSIGVGDVSGLDENTRDVIGTALVAGSGVAVTVDDPGNTITIAVSGVVADAINDGVTTVAPSQNAVFDALALKIAIAALGDLNPVWPNTTDPVRVFAGGSSGTVAATAVVALGITLLRPCTVSAVKISVATAGASSAVGIEIRSAGTDGRPGALLATGTVATTSLGIKTLTLSTPLVLPAGLYFVGTTLNTGTAPALWGWPTATYGSTAGNRGALSDNQNRGGSYVYNTTGGAHVSTPTWALTPFTGGVTANFELTIASTP